MDKIDITKQVLNMHYGEIMQGIVDEVNEDIKSGMADFPRDAISDVNKLTRTKKSKTSNVTSIVKGRDVDGQSLKCIAYSELLAAAGGSLDSWFSRPINFGGAGFILDIRRILGTDNDVDLYLSPSGSEDNIQNTLGSYAGLVIGIAVKSNDTLILEANLYIDKSAKAAEGKGKLIASKDGKNINGTLIVNIVIQS